MIKKLFTLVAAIITITCVHMSQAADGKTPTRKTPTRSRTSAVAAAAAATPTQQQQVVRRVSPRRIPAIVCTPAPTPTFAQEQRALQAILKDHATALEERIRKLELLHMRVHSEQVKESIKKWIGNFKLRIITQQQRAGAC